ncbi:MAG: hypothetical protein RL318_486 [Fibrobacterota bacterium]
MSRRRHKALDLGEAISFDSVLTVLTVLLVLRVVFFVPMVNIDKAKTERSGRDAFWERSSQWVTTHGRVNDAHTYGPAFSCESALMTSLTRSEGAIWLEALLPDSTLLVVRHDTASENFGSMRIQNRSSIPTFRHGRLLWSQTEQAWFTASDSLDYGDRPASKALLEHYRTLRVARESAP